VKTDINSQSIPFFDIKFEATSTKVVPLLPQAYHQENIDFCTFYPIFR
jgi:hypothetical protein